jgi:hypothetical protein
MKGLAASDRKESHMKRLGSWQRGLTISSVYSHLPTIKSTVTLPKSKKNARMRLQIMPLALKDARRDGLRGVY